MLGAVPGAEEFQIGTAAPAEPNFGSGNQSTTQGDPYADVADPKSVAAGRDFTAAQKREFLARNRERNNGVLRSDQTGAELVPSSRSQRGVKPPPNEAQVDHIQPKSKGGTNANSNAQILSRQENRAKSNGLPEGDGGQQ
jgi:HNH endonuclease